jgi:ubiquinone/menaquinone biosynthesis C-methylase UbiE
MKHFIAVLILSGSLTAQVADKANSGYKTKEGREGVARTLSAPDRDARQKPKELVEAMSLTPGMTVIDLGTGVGYMLPYLSKAVGPEGKVIAEDIQSDFLDKAKTKAEQENLSNVTFILGGVDDPKLPENSADAILVLDVYHHFDYPDKMLAHLAKALHKDGRLVIVDFYKRADAMPGGRALEHIRLDQDDAIREVEANGFRLLSKHEHIPKSQYMAIFGKK